MPEWINHFYHANLFYHADVWVILEAQTPNLQSGVFSLPANWNWKKKPVLTVFISSIFCYTLMLNTEHFLPSSEKNMVTNISLDRRHCPSICGFSSTLFFLHTCMNSSSWSIWEKYWTGLYIEKWKNAS